MIRYIKYIFLILFLILFIFGFKNYIGSKIIYSIFTLTSLIMLTYSFKREYYFFEIFFCFFIFLNFWLDFVVTISFYDYFFSEGFGSFTFNKQSLDDILLLSTLVCFSITLSIFLRRKYFPKKDKKLNKIKLSNKFLIFSKKYNILIYLILTIIVGILAFINFKYSIYQRGVANDIEINFFLKYVLQWLLLFGFASFFCVLIDLQISNNIFNRLFTLFILFESLISNLSILSRGNILNSSSIIFAIYKTIRVKRINYLLFSAIFILIFFVLGIELSSPIRGDESIINSSLVFQDFKTNSKSFFKEIIISIKNFFYFIFSRLFGIEALMAVYSLDGLGFDLFYKAFSYKPSIGEVSFFDALKEDYRENTLSKVSITLPGIVAFLYYSGSIYFLLFALLFITLSFSFFEFLIFKYCNSNLLLCSLFSQVIAYRLIHFGYNPSNSYMLLISIFLNVIIIIFFYKIINIIKKNFNI